MYRSRPPLRAALHSEHCCGRDAATRPMRLTNSIDSRVRILFITHAGTAPPESMCCVYLHHTHIPSDASHIERFTVRHD